MSAYQPVLDPACGGRMFWFDKSDDRVLFGDVRDDAVTATNVYILEREANDD